MIQIKFVPLFSIALLCLVAGATQAQEAGCSQESLAEFSVLTGGSSMANLPGCTVSKGQSFCTFNDPLSNVVATVSIDDQDTTPAFDGIKNKTDQVAWKIDCTGGDCPETLGARWVAVQGASAGADCAYDYPTRPAEDGNLYFSKATGGFATINSVTVHSDFKESEEPFVTVSLESCPEDIQNAIFDDLDEGDSAIDAAIVFDISDADSATLCIKDTVTVQECLNRETLPEGATLPLCKDADLDGNGQPDESIPLKVNTTFVTIKVEDESCVFTCVPPPLTLGGRSQCGYLCN